MSQQSAALFPGSPSSRERWPPQPTEGWDPGGSSLQPSSVFETVLLTEAVKYLPFWPAGRDGPGLCWGAGGGA